VRWITGTILVGTVAIGSLFGPVVSYGRDLGDEVRNLSQRLLETLTLEDTNQQTRPLRVGIPPFHNDRLGVGCEPLSSLLAHEIRAGLEKSAPSSGVYLDLIENENAPGYDIIIAGAWWRSDRERVGLRISILDAHQGLKVLESDATIVNLGDMPPEAGACTAEFVPEEMVVPLLTSRNLWAGPSTDSRMLERLPVGTEVRVSATLGPAPWSLVRYPPLGGRDGMRAPERVGYLLLRPAHERLAGLIVDYRQRSAAIVDATKAVNEDIGRFLSRTDRGTTTVAGCPAQMDPEISRWYADLAQTHGVLEGNRAALNDLWETLVAAQLDNLERALVSDRWDEISHFFKPCGQSTADACKDEALEIAREIARRQAVERAAGKLSDALLLDPGNGTVRLRDHLTVEETEVAVDEAAFVNGGWRVAVTAGLMVAVAPTLRTALANERPALLALRPLPPAPDAELLPGQAQGLSLVLERGIELGTLEEGLKAYANREYQRALSILGPLARDGVPRALEQIGWMFFFGRGIEKDRDLAARYYRLGAVRGDSAAQAYLAYRYRIGDTMLDKDPVEAFFWMSLAATGGHRQAPKARDQFRAELTDEERTEVERRLAQWQPTVAPVDLTLRNADGTCINLD